MLAISKKKKQISKNIVIKNNNNNLEKLINIFESELKKKFITLDDK